MTFTETEFSSEEWRVSAQLQEYADCLDQLITKYESDNVWSRTDSVEGVELTTVVQQQDNGVVDYLFVTRQLDGNGQRLEQLLAWNSGEVSVGMATGYFVDVVVKDDGANVLDPFAVPSKPENAVHFQRAALDQDHLEEIGVYVGWLQVQETAKTSTDQDDAEFKPVKKKNKKKKDIFPSNPLFDISVGQFNKRKSI